MNEILNFSLKRIIKEPRPELSFKSGYGMPSDHSQFMFYYAFTIIYTVVKKQKFKSTIISPLISLAISISSFVVAIGRVYVGVHTIEQIVCGSIIGLIFGLFWIALGEKKIFPLFQYLETLPISEWLYLRDSNHVHNPWEFEYQLYKSSKRSIKMN